MEERFILFKKKQYYSTKLDKTKEDNRPDTWQYWLSDNQNRVRHLSASSLNLH